MASKMVFDVGFLALSLSCCWRPGSPVYGFRASPVHHSPGCLRPETHRHQRTKKQTLLLGSKKSGGGGVTMRRPPASAVPPPSFSSSFSASSSSSAEPTPLVSPYLRRSSIHAVFPLSGAAPQRASHRDSSSSSSSSAPATSSSSSASSSSSHTARSSSLSITDDGMPAGPPPFHPSFSDTRDPSIILEVAPPPLSIPSPTHRNSPLIHTSKVPDSDTEDSPSRVLDSLKRVMGAANAFESPPLTFSIGSPSSPAPFSMKNDPSFSGRASGKAVQNLSSSVFTTPFSSFSSSSSATSTSAPALFSSVSSPNASAPTFASVPSPSFASSSSSSNSFSVSQFSSTSPSSLSACASSVSAASTPTSTMPPSSVSAASTPTSTMPPSETLAPSSSPDGQPSFISRLWANSFRLFSSSSSSSSTGITSASLASSSSTFSPVFPLSPSPSPSTPTAPYEQYDFTRHSAKKAKSKTATKAAATAGTTTTAAATTAAAGTQRALVPVSAADGNSVRSLKTKTQNKAHAKTAEPQTPTTALTAPSEAAASSCPSPSSSNSATNDGSSLSLHSDWVLVPAQSQPPRTVQSADNVGLGEDDVESPHEPSPLSHWMEEFLRALYATARAGRAGELHPTWATVRDLLAVSRTAFALEELLLRELSHNPRWPQQQQHAKQPHTRLTVDPQFSQFRLLVLSSDESTNQNATRAPERATRDGLEHALAHWLLGGAARGHTELVRALLLLEVLRNVEWYSSVFPLELLPAKLAATRYPLPLICCQIAANMLQRPLFLFSVSASSSSSSSAVAVSSTASSSSSHTPPSSVFLPHLRVSNDVLSVLSTGRIPLAENRQPIIIVREGHARFVPALPARESRDSSAEVVQNLYDMLHTLPPIAESSLAFAAHADTQLSIPAHLFSANQRVPSLTNHRAPSLTNGSPVSERSDKEEGKCSLHAIDAREAKDAKDAKEAKAGYAAQLERESDDEQENAEEAHTEEERETEKEQTKGSQTEKEAQDSEQAERRNPQRNKSGSKTDEQAVETEEREQGVKERERGESKREEDGDEKEGTEKSRGEGEAGVAKGEEEGKSATQESAEKERHSGGAEKDQEDAESAEQEAESPRDGQRRAGNDQEQQQQQQQPPKGREQLQQQQQQQQQQHQEQQQEQQQQQQPTSDLREHSARGAASACGAATNKKTGSATRTTARVRGAHTHSRLRAGSEEGPQEQIDEHDTEEEEEDTRCCDGLQPAAYTAVLMFLLALLLNWSATSRCASSCSSQFSYF